MDCFVKSKFCIFVQFTLNAVSKKQDDLGIPFQWRSPWFYRWSSLPDTTFPGKTPWSTQSSLQPKHSKSLDSSLKSCLQSLKIFFNKRSPSERTEKNTGEKKKNETGLVFGFAVEVPLDVHAGCGHWHQTVCSAHTPMPPQLRYLHH